MSELEIRKMSIVDADTDCVVNAANEQLQAGGGVCGAIFQAAGYSQLQKACNDIGYCPTGSAVITPGFNMKAKYIIHAVGPIYIDGKHGENKQLYGAYYSSLELMKKNNCHSITFPLISAGIFGYPLNGAWRKAIQACQDFMKKNPDYDCLIIFAILDDNIIQAGKAYLEA